MCICTPVDKPEKKEETTYMSIGNFADTTVKIQQTELQKNQRIIVVSDIHGYADYLEGVLKKVGYTNQDALVIVGDMIEKGPESLKTVRYILKLKEENPHIYATIGNVDYSRLKEYFNDSAEGDINFIKGLSWSKNVWKCGFFLDILEDLGIDFDDVTEGNAGEIKHRIDENYRKELDFFKDLPTILAIGNYIFVHAGIPTDNLQELEGTECFPYLKQDAFLDTDVAFQKTVIVGHWPVCLYREDIDCMNPIFNYDKRVIAIDGGCALKNGAQLNALLIPDAYAAMEEIIYDSYDDYPVIVADHAQESQAKTLVIRYYDCQVELLEEDEKKDEKECDMRRVRHVSLGREFWVPQSFLYKGKDGIYCSDYSDARLEVKQGDRLSVIEKTSAGYIVKKGGVIGWYE